MTGISSPTPTPTRKLTRQATAIAPRSNLPPPTTYPKPKPDATKGHTRVLDETLMDPTPHCLVFGMPIVLYCERCPGYVGAEGFGDMRLNILQTSADPEIEKEILHRHNYKERVFMLIPAQQYAASNALKEFLNQHRSEMSTLEIRLRER